MYSKNIHILISKVWIFVYFLQFFVQLFRFSFIAPGYVYEKYFFFLFKVLYVYVIAYTFPLIFLDLKLLWVSQE